MIPGWMGRGPRQWLAEQAARHRRIVEVGVWMGRSTAILAHHTPGTVWAVDHWQGTPHDPEQHALYPDAARAELAFHENLGTHIMAGKVRVVDLPSLDAARFLAHTESRFDFVFIDADHSYEAVSADIDAWLPLVADGGLLAGHDYKPNYPGVMQAVDDAFAHESIIGPGSIWSYPVRAEVAA
jgi:MMP 1-O-methyltransferase